jgi:hypothetical protein
MGSQLGGTIGNCNFRGGNCKIQIKGRQSKVSQNDDSRPRKRQTVDLAVIDDGDASEDDPVPDMDERPFPEDAEGDSDSGDDDEDQENPLDILGEIQFRAAGFGDNAPQFVH